ncbi:MAG TPA: hypothetical protein VIJ78_04225 [Pseudolabrys sp.]
MGCYISLSRLHWDVPVHLKKALNALSGLFFVADSQFESFYRESQLSKKRAATKIISGPSQQDSDVNLDTVSAYLVSKFSNRGIKSGLASDLVQELRTAGYKTIAQIDADVERAYEAAEAYEGKYNKGHTFNSIGITRAALDICSEKFREARKSIGTAHENNDYKILEFKNLVRK